ncbi:terminase small subunit [Salimicrobium jeotgali]|uniref:Terminase small subunit n=2 Tax=Salimicrobium jeotgali TaxID=1230341 RepID=K2FH74_9BACI|nr:terminase small subunit [Salimicrobium jeotgali]MBM7696624.1 phage terminase small subunit [Salimicrobium jeotgali]
MMAKMTEKQKRFADYYIKTGNASEAARNAGYSAKTAHRIGQENLQKPAIYKYIEKRNKELEDSRTADMKEVREFWTGMMRDRMVEPKDRLKASEFIAKTNGAFIERVEHSGEVQNNVDLSDLTVEELRKIANSDD